MDSQLDLSPGNFQAVHEFVEEINQDDLQKHDRSIHSHHPLVVFVQTVLEAVARYEFSASIVGFSRRSEAQLVQERRRLETTDGRASLEQLLFLFERISRAVRESGYASRETRGSEEFFTELFPEWLSAFESWAAEKGFVDLADTARRTREEYSAIADEIVTAA